MQQKPTFEKGGSFKRNLKTSWRIRKYWPKPTIIKPQWPHETDKNVYKFRANIPGGSHWTGRPPPTLPQPPKTAHRSAVKHWKDVGTQIRTSRTNTPPWRTCIYLSVSVFFCVSFLLKHPSFYDFFDQFLWKLLFFVILACRLQGPFHSISVTPFHWNKNKTRDLFYSSYCSILLYLLQWKSEQQNWAIALLRFCKQKRHDIVINWLPLEICITASV